MKVFLGKDTAAAGAGRLGYEFCTVTVSREAMDAYRGACDNSARIDRKAELPLIVRIFRGFMILMTAVIGMALPSMLGDWQGMGEGAMVFGCCLGIVLLINGAARRRRARVTGSEAGRRAAEELAGTVDDLYRELGVPQSAQTAEVLLFVYSMKNGRIDADRGNNIAMQAWVEDGALYLASLDQKFVFPIGEMRGICAVREQIILEKWRKSVPYNKEPYAAYDMTMDEGDLYAKGFCVLELSRGGEEWGICFPEYEREAFERLTGLKAE